MSANGTTDIADLPSIPMDSVQQPIQLHTTEKNTQNQLQDQSQGPLKIDSQQISQLQQQRENETKDMNTLVTGIQNASINGGLKLPERDIPQHNNHITQDEQTRVNYIPNSQNDYIGQGPTSEDIVREHAAKQRDKGNTEDMLDILHIPIILSILYFAFHMPILQKFLFEKLQFLYMKDGNMSIIGSVFMSIVFAGSYVGIMHILDYLSV